MVEGGEDTQKIYAILIKKFTTKEKIINFLHEFVKSFGDKQEKQKKFIIIATIVLGRGNTSRRRKILQKFFVPFHVTFPFYKE